MAVIQTILNHGLKSHVIIQLVFTIYSLKATEYFNI